MISSRDAARARAFQAGRAQVRQVTQGSTTLELAEVRAALEHYKTKLQQAVATQNSSVIDQLLEQLFTLRSTQSALTLKQKQQIINTISY